MDISVLYFIVHLGNEYEFSACFFISNWIVGFRLSTETLKNSKLAGTSGAAKGSEPYCLVSTGFTFIFYQAEVIGK